MTIRLDLPGEVKAARAINIGPVQIRPEVTEGEQGQVTWKLPLSALMAANARQAMTLSCDYEGEYHFSKLVQSQQRKEKMQVHSNFPGEEPGSK